MEINPTELLAKHRHLLEGDFHDLRSTFTGICETWLVLMKLAVTVSENIQLSRPSKGNPGSFESSPTMQSMDVHPEAENSAFFCMDNPQAMAYWYSW